MRKSVCIILISIKDYLKIDDEDGFSFSIPCLVLEIFVFYNIIEGRSGYFRDASSNNFIYRET